MAVKPSNFLLRTAFVTLTDHICIHTVEASEYLWYIEKIKVCHATLHDK